MQKPSRTFFNTLSNRKLIKITRKIIFKKYFLYIQVIQFYQRIPCTLRYIHFEMTNELILALSQNES